MYAVILKKKYRDVIVRCGEYGENYAIFTKYADAVVEKLSNLRGYINYILSVYERDNELH